MVTSTASISGSGCNEHKLSVLKTRWTYLLGQKTQVDKLYLSRAVLDDIAKYSKYLAALLQSLYLNESHHRSTTAAMLSIDMWDVIIGYYPDAEQLKTLIQYDAATKTELARVFYGNARIIGQSVVK